MVITKEAVEVGWLVGESLGASEGRITEYAVMTDCVYNTSWA